jgi:hypothetical protein
MKHEFRWALRSWLGDTVGWPMPNGLVAVLQVRYSTDDGGWSEWADIPSAVVLS